MRSVVILLSVAVSFVLATSSPNVDVNQEDLSVKDPRDSIWRKMKVALPDGYYAGEEDNTPLIATPEEELLLPGRRPLYKHQQIKNVDDPAYKHLEITEHTNITPLSPSEKVKLDKENQGGSRSHKKFMELNGQAKVEEQDVNGVQQKKVAGTDLNGQMRYVDIPYYNRGNRREFI